MSLNAALEFVKDFTFLFIFSSCTLLSSYYASNLVEYLVTERLMNCSNSFALSVPYSTFVSSLLQNKQVTQQNQKGNKALSILGELEE